MCDRAEAAETRAGLERSLERLIDICSGPACQVKSLLGDKEPATKLMPDPLMDPILAELFRIP